MGLSTLPYDLLLNIALYLDLRDIHALHLTCKTLHDFTTTRPVYRKLATDLLRNCRALPLKGFQRLTDLTTEQLIRSVNQAARYDNAWRWRAPRPIGLSTDTFGTSHYMDGPSHLYHYDPSYIFHYHHHHRHHHHHLARSWYKVVSAPPDEEVDWLSPITSSYTLCATKSGKVVCWDVQTDTCLAEWNPGERWELWKCRVEFEERTVYFTMAKILDSSQDDSRVMEFVLMRLTFSDPPSGESSPEKPIFSRVTEFRTMGVVMNIFLLDPSARLLSAFVWVATSNTIGLYALLDWSKPEYVFIDTGIDYVMSANWSCILYDQHIVIHCEQPEAAHQYFYPFSLLRMHSTYLRGRLARPRIMGRVPPARVLTKKFLFPRLASGGPTTNGHAAGGANEEMVWLNTLSPQMVLLLPPITPTQALVATPNAPVPSTSIDNAATSITSSSALALQPAPTPPPQGQGPPLAPPPSTDPCPNPFPWPQWYPESAHFVRQWWPSLPGIPRVSCTVVLLAMHDQATHRNRFVLAQHYFKVPIDWGMWVRGEGGGAPSEEGSASSSSSSSSTTREGDEDLMKMWYVSRPFEVVRVFDERDEEDGQMLERPRPLVAVDFGHAVWIEYRDEEMGVAAAAAAAGVPRASSADVSGEEASASSSAKDDVPLIDGAGDGVSGVEEMDTEEKVLKFVTFPKYNDGPEWYHDEVESDWDEGTSEPLTPVVGGKGKGKEPVSGEDTMENGVYSPKRHLSSSSSRPQVNGKWKWGAPESEGKKRKGKWRQRPRSREAEGVVRTLDVPDELDLGAVETINIDQSQGAVILSDRDGRIFILCYE